MNRKKLCLPLRFVLWVTALTAASIMVPWIIVQPISVPIDMAEPQLAPELVLPEDKPRVFVPVYMSTKREVEQIALEDYVRGVVAAEMPIEFELEALKAQALAARTYIVRRMLESDTSNVPVVGALVTDTIQHQAYISEEQLKAKWASAYSKNWNKLTQAVQETAGLVLTFEGKPINATFFSTSNGFTENSEEYWKEFVPYLRSVSSPWDQQISPRYTQTITIGYDEFKRKLGMGGIVQLSFAGSSGIMERTTGKRVKTVSVEGKVFSGREVRERLGLHSSHFQWEIQGQQVTITTFGYGHGVGMSQWGANGMAKEGYAAEQIVKHYYTGIDLAPVNAILNLR